MDVYITGHRNPDMDSICSAWTYAVLKNRLDDGNRYIPSMLGPANSNTRRFFASLSLDLPCFLHDVRPRVEEVRRTPTYSMTSSDPVYFLIDLYSRMKPTVVPVIDDGEFRGLLSSDDINSFFLRESRHGERMLYTLSEENLGRVVKGTFLKHGSADIVSAPIMVGAMEYGVFLSRLEKCHEKPVLVIGDRRKHLEAAVADGLPGIVLTGIDRIDEFDFDFSSFEGFVYVSALDTAETLRLLRLSTPVSAIIHDEAVKLDSSMLFDDAKRTLQESEYRGLSVYKDGKWDGFVTRRCFLDKPRKKLILVDHNETEQSVKGIEDAEIVEILDHHRLAAPRMRTPIYICSEPLGSTCTIIYEQFRKWGVEIDSLTAKVLLAGLVADTVMLKSPTTTDYDRHVARQLAAIASVDLQSFSEEIFASDATLSERDLESVIRSDMKKYRENGVSFAIGQAEVTNLEEVDDVRDRMRETLEKVREAEAVDWCMLLVTDVIRGSSVLFSTDYPLSEKLAYDELSAGIFNLPGILSRKKQLLPEILRVVSGE